MCRFMALWSSVLVKLAFSCTSMYLEHSLLTSVRPRDGGGGDPWTGGTFPSSSCSFRS